ncbi:hypothetical protein EJ04DRAFT_590938 [Polyplosphaeria fusca]|uniref:Uncharacterized protein n=1 Tax=Polyplosphaeria fusca TaxID=682080 RepID=A0A9P4UXB1_9PLEO|nr:hypothetical protein EJ04DRAFT_590938 [Polyplosphaeria fusca]
MAFLFDSALIKSETRSDDIREPDPTQNLKLCQYELEDEYSSTAPPWDTQHRKSIFHAPPPSSATDSDHIAFEGPCTATKPGIVLLDTARNKSTAPTAKLQQPSPPEPEDESINKWRKRREQELEAFPALNRKHFWMDNDNTTSPNPRRELENLADLSRPGRRKLRRTVR